MRHIDHTDIKTHLVTALSVLYIKLPDLLSRNSVVLSEVSGLPYVDIAHYAVEICYLFPPIK